MQWIESFYPSHDSFYILPGLYGHHADYQDDDEMTSILRSHLSRELSCHHLSILHYLGISTLFLPMLLNFYAAQISALYIRCNWKANIVDLQASQLCLAINRLGADIPNYGIICYFQYSLICKAMKNITLFLHFDQFVLERIGQFY